MSANILISTKGILRLLFILTFITILSCSSDDAEKVPETPETIFSLVDGLMESRQATNQPGLSVLIRKDGNIVYQNSRGLARTLGNHAIDENTSFRIGSITKTFTALAIMQLVEQDLISLQDKLVSIVPELPSVYADMTIEHLLAHQAGLLDYIDDNTNLASLDGITTSQIIDLIPSSGLLNLMFEPGSSAEYNNTGYVFLALIIEKISGMDYPTYMDTNFFDPIGMTNSFVISENQHLGDVNDNYALNFASSINVKGFNSLIYGPSGIASSVNDLNLFVDALLNNEIVSSETLQTMLQPKSSISWLGDYGLGWILGTGNNYWHQEANLTDRNDYWHIGGFDGYRSMLSINPDMDLEIIILTNNGDFSQETSYVITRQVREFYKNN